MSYGVSGGCLVINVVRLDLNNDGISESKGLDKIAITNDTYNIFTQPEDDKLLIDVSQIIATIEGVSSLTLQGVQADYIDFASEYDNGTVSINTTINWNNGNDQVVTLGADITLSFSNMGVGHKQLRVVQDATGGRTPTLPSGKWPGGTAGVFSTAAGAEDILSIYYNGTSYYYQLTANWS